MMVKETRASRFIYSGTPGSGKTSVIKKLEQHGHIVVHEAATDVIAIGQAKGIEKPWEESWFVDEITLMQKDRQLEKAGELQFYDRAPFCTYALAVYLAKMKNSQFEPSRALSAEIERCLTERVYESKIFFFENLGFVAPTSARRINYEEALAFEKIHLSVYQMFGLEIVLVPRLTVEERCKFVLKSVGLR